jgi:hypothetical protein
MEKAPPASRLISAAAPVTLGKLRRIEQNLVSTKTQIASPEKLDDPRFGGNLLELRGRSKSAVQV